MSDVKEAAIHVIDSLPDDTDWQDIMRELYFRMKVEAGLREADEGKTIPWEDVKAEFGLL
jgi:predicted transcriptional regulator